MNYDWCASLTGSYLPLLRRLNFYLHVVELGEIDINNTVGQLVENFQSAHNARYRSCFVIGHSQVPNLFELKIPM
jgi:hypothetical protein